MNATITDRAAVWRGRGRPRSEVPAELARLFDSTREPDQVAVVDYNPADPAETAEIAEIVRLFESYAKARSLIPRVQHDPGQLRLQLGERAA